MKPEKPITRKEMYLDVATGGSTELPSPVTREEKYLAKIAGESVDVPTPVTRYEMLLAAVAGESYTLTPATRLEIYLAKAAGQDVEIPQPVTREEMYWFDYCGGTPTPPEREYTGAVPVTFVADGTPLLDYIISGNTVQSGTPTPDSPIMPQGTGERTGNLFDVSSVIYGTWADNNGRAQTYGYGARSINISSNQITVSFNGSVFPYSYSIVWLDSNDEFIVRNHKSTSSQIREPQTFTPPSNAAKFYIQLANGTDANYPITKEQIESYKLMLNTGSTPLPYEPFGYKIPISSANTTTPVYLGEVETTRKIKKLVLTGEENWSRDSATGVFFTDITNALQASFQTGICSHWPFERNRGVYSLLTEGHGCIRNAYNSVWIRDNNFTIIADFKSYLAAQYASGTPVTVWYVLATEETAVVNEPLTRIGDYADALSMEQAGAQIPTANGSTTLDVETTVSPSEVYIKYRGEAVATLSALSAEGSSSEATTEEENPEETEEEENGSEDVSLQHELEAIE